MVRRFLVASLVALATSAALFACSYHWDLPADAGADATTTSADGSSLADGGALTDASSADATDASGCRSNNDCQPNYQCFFPDFKCGKGVVGRCELSTLEQAAACNNAIAAGGGSSKYCGCNGMQYTSPCALLEAGTALNADGCGPDLGYTNCGYVACDSSLTYCVDRRGSATPYSCASWNGCVTKNCACNWQVSCDGGGALNQCMANVTTNGVIVTCF